ncbi:hypothetical protein Aeh1ORF269c [Aeromonas phage Aeh1]|uniref:Uncharacterized protein n=1 Tax=Aeromonas phage Aeh1 TaxID=2880362 RepID=Q76YG2_9CAUD|nr:hypothetical protein Aeh1p283 [Aeromonas phage Aeh1]AAQ17933.1 hypothetical protein Aeh1ORF269c [Aeromonas phage Aeh1]
MKAKLNAFEEDQARIEITDIEVEFERDTVLKAIAQLQQELEDDEHGYYDSCCIELEIKVGEDYYCERIFSNDGAQEFEEISDKMQIVKDVRDAFGPNSVRVITNALYLGVDIYRFYVVYKENEKVVYLNDQTPYNRMCGMHGKHSKNVRHDEIVPYLAELVNKE